MRINMARVKAALPVESGNGRRSIVRARSDVAEIVVDCVLRRRPFLEIAQRCAVNVESLNRFRKKFITPEVEKIVLIEANKMDADQLDEQVNKAQDGIEAGVMGVLDEQQKLYRKLNQMTNSGERDLDDVLAPMMQLLRDQTKSYEAMLKVYQNLKDKTTIVLSLNEHPDVAKLMDALWVVFKLHPVAFEEFKQVVKQKRIPLDVE